MIGHTTFFCYMCDIKVVSELNKYYLLHEAHSAGLDFVCVCFHFIIFYPRFRFIFILVLSYHTFFPYTGKFYQ